METLRRPPLWLLVPAVPAVVGLAAIVWWTPLVLFFASLWLVGIVWARLRGAKLLSNTEAGYSELVRRRLSGS